MERLLLIIFIYLIFGVIGPMLRRAQRKQKQVPPQPQPQPSVPTPGEQTSQQQVEAKAETHYKRLQDAFRQQTPSSELPVPQQQESKLLSIPTKSVPPPLPAKPRVSVGARPISRRQAPSRTPQLEQESLLGFNKRGGYMRGIILAEILGPPVSKRPKK